MSLTFALQALLVRHETYMFEAEEERRKMTASIDKLEADKRELEALNARTIEENRHLLEQLEDLDNTVTSSDNRILSLNATLQSTRKELERLTILAAQTTQLEAQLLALESQQAGLEDLLASKEEDQRSTVERWKIAERTISHLHEQVDRIEREAIDERERHSEVLSRFQRRRSVERELEKAEGRLKGAAAATTLGKDKGSSSVVSHFVKDILQDNANLQAGIVELREMLMGSNEEVENLREQMMLHQPVLPDNEHNASTALESELPKTPAAEALPEFHVHHHYHEAIKAEKITRERSTLPRRPRKKRNVLTTGYNTPASGSQTPRTPSVHAIRTARPSSTATILSQTSVSIPPPSQPSCTHRWSSQSSQTWSSTAPSSVPNSPQTASMFDCVDVSMDMSRPTSPESMSLDSPPFFSQHRKRGSDVSCRRLSTPGPGLRPVAHQSISDVLHSTAGDIHGDRSAIPEEQTDNLSPALLAPRPTSDANIDDIHPLTHPRLHRSASYESILSLCPTTLPPLRSQRSQLLNAQLSRRLTPLNISGASSQPLTSSTTTLAHPFLNPTTQSSSAATSALTLAAATAASGQSKFNNTLKTRVGGWVWSKWGISPTPTASTSPFIYKPPKYKAALGNEKAKEKRPTGVNQPGSIRHLRPPGRVVSHVEAVGVDERLLRESLGEG